MSDHKQIEVEPTVRANSALKGVLGGAFFASLINPAILPIVIGSLIGGAIGSTLAKPDTDDSENGSKTNN